MLLIISGSTGQTAMGYEARLDRNMLESLRPASVETFSFVWAKKPLCEDIPRRIVPGREGRKGTSIVVTVPNRCKITTPLGDLKYEPVSAMRVDGQVLTLRDKGPPWVVYPGEAAPALQAPIYEARWIWQLIRLQVEQP
ncbi:hypothetical protein [Microvirga makkahensis]|uniref:hypothetical protein n=1 Tax=Microvirga makkahensis TaxID=1128670 RepID=UPI00197BA21F|nr:hypothetical protein [Microvirga makkahensis]